MEDIIVYIVIGFFMLWFIIACVGALWGQLFKEDGEKSGTKEDRSCLHIIICFILVIVGFAVWGMCSNAVCGK